MFDIVEALYYFIPITAVLFFAVSLFRYLYAKHKNKRMPGTFSEREMKNRRLWLIVSSVIAGMLAAALIALVILLFMAVAFM